MSTPFPKNTASLRLNPYKHSVALQTSRKRFAKFCPECCGPVLDGVSGRAVYCACQGMYYVGVFDKQISTLAHECAHIAFFLLGAVGVPTHAGDVNEAYCYLLGFMMREFGPVIMEGAQ